jgi:hypothetical protein
MQAVLGAMQGTAQTPSSFSDETKGPTNFAVVREFPNKCLHKNTKNAKKPNRGGINPINNWRRTMAVCYSSYPTSTFALDRD